MNKSGAGYSELMKQTVAALDGEVMQQLLVSTLHKVRSRKVSFVRGTLCLGPQLQDTQSYHP
jgi:hypothetical protein